MAYNQKKVSEFVSCYFALLGVGCSIVASEITYGYNLDDANKDNINMLHIISNVTAGCISKLCLVNLLSFINHSK